MVSGGIFDSILPFSCKKFKMKNWAGPTSGECPIFFLEFLRIFLCAMQAAVPVTPQLMTATATAGTVMEGMASTERKQADTFPSESFLR